MKERVAAFIHAQRGLLLVVLGLTAVYFFAYFQRVAIPGTVFDELQTDLGIAAGQVALLGAIYPSFCI
jgi:hypothetical protein